MSVDLRKSVEEDRGLIKHIQLILPGFRGYRLKEDIRIADSMLRIQIADELNNTVIKNLELTRETAGMDLEMDLMNDIAKAISKAKTAEAKIRHAEQGYSGISSAYHVKEDELNALYEYDLDMINGVHAVGDYAKESSGNAENGDYDKVKSDLKRVTSGITELIEIFDKRIESMAGIGAI